ncbi:lysozyme [Hymenobacter canadensis]|uniref:Lysozyme n=1 Tax=Hymenobacter canadensis TaxID=2999067 RepID=A0ABY7LVP5_9BACT|nr:lysozyme [Hymenobacter canadensis]WBA42983.1 lysozyme [Hymenobacter canadensis]
MSVHRKTDAAGRAFITKEEGEVLQTYRCAAGVATIGVGHTGPDVLARMRITREQSQMLLSQDLARFEAAVNRVVTVPLTQNQFNALVSFAFNLGEAALAKSSLVRYVNTTAVRDQATLQNYFRIWRNVNGKPNAAIEARRLREAALFSKP